MRFGIVALLLLGTPALTKAHAAVAATDAPRVSTPSEAVVAALSREALKKPASIETWVGLARSLRALRPAAWKDVPTSAERLAMHVADSLASATHGALTELRLEEGEGRTEIAVEVTGEVRYRLFRRLSDPVDPRLTLEIHDAVPGLLEPRYAGLDRGGVRELRVTPTDSGTVQVAISLAGPRTFGVEERDGELVVWIRSDEGSFTPWRSRPTWARGEPETFEGAAPELALARLDDAGTGVVLPAGGTPADAMGPGAVAGIGADRDGADRDGRDRNAVDGNVANRKGGDRVGEDRDVWDRAGEDPAGVAWTDSGRSGGNGEKGLRASLTALAARAPLGQAAARVRAVASGLDSGLVATVGLAIVLVIVTASALRRRGGRPVLGHAAASARPHSSERALERVIGRVRVSRSAGSEPAVAGTVRRSSKRWASPRRRAASGAASSRDARLWTVRTLAAQGASEAEIARSTGLSQDAVLLIVRSLGDAIGGPSGERTEPEGSAAPGNIFRPRGHERNAAMAGAR